MPHFYRYRVEDNFTPRSGRTPAPTPSMARKAPDVKGLTASLGLLGCQANISVPEDSDKVSLALMFSQLDTALRELREENKILR